MKWVAIRDKWGVIHLLNLTNVVSISRLTEQEEPAILINLTESRKETGTHTAETTFSYMKIVFDSPERRDEVFKRLFEMTVASYI
jgi:hypothetical protein